MSFLASAFAGLTRRICTTPLNASLRALTSSTVPQTADDEKRRGVFANINSLLKTQNEGRLFAVVHLCGKQFKVTSGDIILVEGHWPPATGDKIRLDKVLLAGSKDFTLIGRPLLEPRLVDVQATVIEKTLSHTKTHFRKKRRKQYMRINFYRAHNTMIRINTIEIGGQVNSTTAKDAVSAEKLFGN